MKFPRWSPWQALLCPILAVPAAAAAQPAPQAPICPDRPGKATGTCTVAPGYVQLEVGLADWSLRKDSGSRETSLAIANTVIKFGLSERSNIALALTPYARSAVRSGGAPTSASGFGDVAVSYKHRITPNGTGIVVALLPTLKIPTAKRDLGNGKLEGALLVPISYAVPESSFSVGATPEVDWIADGDGRGHHASMAQVVSLGWAATNRLSLAAELWGQWDWDPAGTAKQSSLDGSVAYAVSDDVQIDAGANLGLTRQTPDSEFYMGLSVRF